MVVNNDSLLKEVEQEFPKVQMAMENEVIMSAFSKDFSFRFCWSSNALEGNTLSLDETVSLIEYDEVRSGHTYTEYQEAKNLYHAITKNLIPFQSKEMDEDWIKENSGIILGTNGDYRQNNVFVGSLAEAQYYAPDFGFIPDLVKDYMKGIHIQEADFSKLIEKIAKSHFSFERIHPFPDGNGRVGRMILNQQLINNGFLPVAFRVTGKYRQSFRIYNRNGDMSLLIHELCKAELNSIQRICDLEKKFHQEFVLDPFKKKEKLEKTKEDSSQKRKCTLSIDAQIQDAVKKCEGMNKDKELLTKKHKLEI